jgi:hypothetical protein
MASTATSTSTASSATFPTTAPATSLVEAVRSGITNLQNQLAEALSLLEAAETAPQIATATTASVVTSLASLSGQVEVQVLEALENTVAVPATGRCGPRTQQRAMLTLGKPKLK